MGKSSKVGFAFLTGLAAGWVVSMFMSPQDKKRARNLMSKKSAQLKQLLTDREEQERIKDIFSKKSKQAEDMYESAKAVLIDNISQIQGTLEEVDVSKYKEAVKDTLLSLKEDHNLPKEQLTKLKKYFESDFAKLKQGKKNGVDIDEL